MSGRNGFRNKRFLDALETFEIGEEFTACDVSDRSGLRNGNQVSMMLRQCDCVEKVSETHPFRYRRIAGSLPNLPVPKTRPPGFYDDFAHSKLARWVEDLPPGYSFEVCDLATGFGISKDAVRNYLTPYRKLGLFTIEFVRRERGPGRRCVWTRTEVRV